MVAETIAGPFAQVSLSGGAVAPWYVVEFDKNGACTSPKSRDHLLRAIRGGAASHVFVFVHGWNNAWEEVRSLSGTFFSGFAGIGPSPAGEGFRPIFVTVFWPSIAMVLPEEQGPQFAAGDAAVAESDARALETLAGALPARRRERLRQLASKDALTQDELKALARLLAPLYRRPDEASEAEMLSAEELVELWRAAAADLGAEGAASGDGDFGFADDEPTADGPAAAGGLIDWVRLPYRMATVWQMKDRAGVVGARGVGRLLRAILSGSPDVRLHLAGHSYGCRVLLSAISAEPLPHPVESLLLLQPAISHLCFAERIEETGRPGGYRPAMDRVAQPIICTFSRHDWPLHNFFHLALRRPGDLGEASIAGAPPSRYAALGGYGPGGVGSAAVELPIKAAQQSYDLRPGGVRVIALDGSDVQKPDGKPAISHHGDINHPMAWWLLYSQVAAGGSA